MSQLLKIHHQLLGGITWRIFRLLDNVYLFIFMVGKIWAKSKKLESIITNHPVRAHGTAHPLDTSSDHYAAYLCLLKPESLWHSMHHEVLREIFL